MSERSTGCHGETLCGGDVTLHVGDCLDVIAGMEPDSVDAIVTDPPYGIGFMGRAWDGDAIREAARRDAAQRSDLGPHSSSRPGRSAPRSTSAFGNAASYAGPVEGGAAFQWWCQRWGEAVLRVAKPGTHLLAFGGTRTHHRLYCGLEDAGWEIRDTCAWLYGSGFPKSLDVSKAIDKAEGVDTSSDGRWRAEPHPGRLSDTAIESEFLGQRNRRGGRHVYVPTEAARRWQGWGTALKPAFEPIVLARKPLPGTVADNVRRWGTGALNIDGCRIGTDEGGYYKTDRTPRESLHDHSVYGYRTYEELHKRGGGHAGGRWPANVVLDEQAAAIVDAQAGERPPGGNLTGAEPSTPFANVYGDMNGRGPWRGYGDSGGPSRFFYCAKASSSEKPWQNGQVGKERCGECGGWEYGNPACDCDTPRWERNDGTTMHPTVKPLDLMRWLVRLVTPPGGLILDPFAGTGTTAEAAIIEGFRCVLVEREADYADLCRARLRKPIQPTLGM